MNTENALLGLILVGTGVCLAYFWAEMARRKQDRIRAQSPPVKPAALKRASGDSLVERSRERRKAA